MGILQKKRRTPGKKALAYRGKSGQNTGTAFLALRLGVVLYLLKNLVTIFFPNLFGRLVHIFGKLVHIFGEFVHILGKLVQIFAWKLVSRTLKQVSRNLGQLWQPGVYNDTKQRGRTSPDPEKIPEPLRGPPEAFLWELLEKKESKGPFSSERLRRVVHLWFCTAALLQHILNIAHYRDTRWPIIH